MNKEGDWFWKESWLELTWGWRQTQARNRNLKFL